MSDFFLKTWSDTFRSVLMYGKEQESRKTCHDRAKKTHVPERVSLEKHVFYISRNLIGKLVFK